jgi:hypothetical protein
MSTTGIDVLNEFTKDEIITWLRENYPFLRIRRRDMLFMRWHLQSKKLQNDYQSELDRWGAEKPDFKKRDALAAEFNNTQDRTRRLRLLEEIELDDAALTEHIRRTQALDKRQRAVDRLYAELDKEAA